MKSILIVTSGPLCRNPRVLKEATSLGNAGFDVTVATIANIERFEIYDRVLLNGAPFRVRALDRLPGQPARRLLALVERARSWAARRAIGSGVERPESLGPYGALLRLSLSIRADLTIVHTELPFCVGVALQARGRAVATDFEDWHSRDLLPAARRGRPLRLLADAERVLMNRSVYTTAPSDAMAAALREAYGGPLPVVIPNTFPLQPEPRRIPRNSPPSFFWFSQTIGEGRGLEEFVGGWALSKAPSSICLLGDVSDSFRDTLLGIVPPGRRELMKFLPITSPENLPSVIAEHDIGLALEHGFPESRNLTATNKIFQYLNAGLAVLATPTVGQREVLSMAPGCGELIDLGAPAALADQIDLMLSNPSQLAAMGSAARAAAVLHFSWEKSSPLLIEAVTTAIESHDRA
jgi:glycosyltransferase involved in cell wall biosynthesis